MLKNNTFLYILSILVISISAYYYYNNTDFNTTYFIILIIPVKSLKFKINRILSFLIRILLFINSIYRYKFSIK